MTRSTRHRWGEDAPFPHKTEQQCIRCGMVMVRRHESEGGRDIYWTEFWRDEEKIEFAGTPPCGGALNQTEPGAGGHPAPSASATSARVVVDGADASLQEGAQICAGLPVGRGY